MSGVYGDSSNPGGEACSEADGTGDSWPRSASADQVRGKTTPIDHVRAKTSPIDQVRAKTSPEWAVRPERSNRAMLRFIVWVALNLGRPAARCLLPPICLYYLLFAPKVHVASREFLTRALGRKPGLADYYRHIYTFAATLLDRVFLLNGQLERFDVRVHGQEVMDDMLASGEGCFLLGSHLGSFEIIRTLGRESRGLEVSLVMYEENARQVNAILDAINPRLSMQVIGLGKPDSMLKVMEALERGKFVGMLGDRNFANEGTAACTFLGSTTHCPLGPFRMAAMLKRPIVLMFGLYRGGTRYDIHFERLPDIVTAPRGQRAQAIERSLQDYVQRMEHYCRLAPYNWFNFYGFWDQEHHVAG